MKNNANLPVDKCENFLPRGILVRQMCPDSSAARWLCSKCKKPSENMAGWENGWVCPSCFNALT